jgi:hypothetical protein
MQEDMPSFRKKLIVQLLNSNLNEIDITKPLPEEDDQDEENNDPDECNITGHIYND